jgi:hypothetical protein
MRTADDGFVSTVEAIDALLLLPANLNFVISKIQNFSFQLPTVFGSVVEGSSGGRLFQQTHDFLVARFGGHSQSSSAASVRMVRVGASQE